MSRPLEVIAQTLNASPRVVQPPTEFDSKMLCYLLLAALIGAFSSVANLLADEKVQLTKRILIAQALLGAGASFGVVTMLVEKYGDSWLLLGCGVFAGYGAASVFMAGSLALNGIVKRLFGKV